MIDLEVRFQSHRSSTLLSTPEMKIDANFQHKFVLPGDKTLQQFLQKAFVTSPITATDGNIVFEVWRRHYVPNVRDQLVAKVTMICWMTADFVLLKSTHLLFLLWCSVHCCSLKLGIN